MICPLCFHLSPLLSPSPVHLGLHTPRTAPHFHKGPSGTTSKGEVLIPVSLYTSTALDPVCQSVLFEQFCHLLFRTNHPGPAPSSLAVPTSSYSHPPQCHLLGSACPRLGLRPSCFSILWLHVPWPSWSPWTLRAAKSGPQPNLSWNGTHPTTHLHAQADTDLGHRHVSPSPRHLSGHTPDPVYSHSLSILINLPKLPLLHIFYSLSWFIISVIAYAV